MSKKTALMVAAGACLLLMIALGFLMQEEDGPEDPADLPAAGGPTDGAVADEPKLLKLENYIRVEGVEGVSGKGVLKYVFDEKAFKDDCQDPLPEVTEENFAFVMAASIQAADTASKAADSVHLSVSQETGLKNGDTVTVEARFMPNVIGQTFPFKVQGCSITYTVSGLTELKAFDPFDEQLFKLRFSGYNGAGTVEVLSEGQSLYNRWNYSFSAVEQLFNGDTVTVIYKVSDGSLEADGYAAPAQREKTYTVAGLERYHELSDGIPQKDLDMMKAKAVAAIQAEINTMVPDAVAQLEAVWYLKAHDDQKPFEDRFADLEFCRGIVVLVRADSPTGAGLSYLKENWYMMIFPNCRLEESGSFTWNTEREDMRARHGISKDEAYAWVRDKFSEAMTLTPIG